ALFAYGPEGIDIMAERVDGHRTMRMCVEGPPYVDFSYYEWRGREYDQTRLEVRGHRVDYLKTERRLRPLVAAVDVKATPTTQGESVGHYDLGTDVVVIGTAGTYYYVSPCNACASGFVPTSAVRAE